MVFPGNWVEEVFLIILIISEIVKVFISEWGGGGGVRIICMLSTWHLSYLSSKRLVGEGREDVSGTLIKLEGGDGGVSSSFNQSVGAPGFWMFV